MSGGQPDVSLIQREYEWLINHNNMREYKMIMMYDPLDDDIPW